MILSKLIIVYTTLVTKPNQAEVYFIRDSVTQTVKIGKTGIHNSPNRLKQLQTGNPTQLSLVRTIQTKTHADAFQLEAQLHKKYANKHYRGEWFKGID